MSDNEVAKAYDRSVIYLFNKVLKGEGFVSIHENQAVLRDLTLVESYLREHLKVDQPEAPKLTAVTKVE